MSEEIPMERPVWARKDGETHEAYAARREDYVAAHRKERNTRNTVERITERTVETIREVPVIQPTEMDEAARARIDQLEREARESVDMIAYLLEVGELEPIIASAPVIQDEPEIDLGAPMAPQALQGLMLEGETITDAKVRLWPILNNELAELKNKEALFGVSIPRRAEVELLIGVLAMVGDAKQQ